MASPSVLFVCLGNICRSPLAEGIFRAQSHNYAIEFSRIDSAGTSGWHIGEPPDPRSIEIADSHGIDIGEQRSRKLVQEDFHTFDYIFAMDQSNLTNCQKLAPHNSRAKIVKILPFAGMGEGDIPDPYYGGPGGFESVFQLLKEAAGKSLERLEESVG